MYGEGAPTNQVQQNNNNGQQNSKHLNSGYPGTQSRAQQLEDGAYDPNKELTGCTQNMKTFAVVSIALIIIGFIMAFLVNSSSLFIIGLFLIITGCIMILCMLCNACGFVPCFICLCGPPIWIPVGGGPIFWQRRTYGGQPAGGYPAGHGAPQGGGGGYPGGQQGGTGGGYPGRV